MGETHTDTFDHCRSTLMDHGSWVKDHRNSIPYRFPCPVHARTRVGTKHRVGWKTVWLYTTNSKTTAMMSNPGVALLLSIEINKPHDNVQKLRLTKGATTVNSYTYGDACVTASCEC